MDILIFALLGTLFAGFLMALSTVAIAAAASAAACVRHAGTTAPVSTSAAAPSR